MTISDSLQSSMRVAILLCMLTGTVHAQDAEIDEGGAASSDSGGDAQSSGSAFPSDEGLGNSMPSTNIEETDPSRPEEEGSSLPEEVGEEAGDAASQTEFNDYDHEPGDALDAVQQDRALPFDSIVATARRLTDGQIIDTRLEAVNGFLQYELKILEPTNEVRRYSFDARSGELVGVR